MSVSSVFPYHSNISLLTWRKREINQSESESEWLEANRGLVREAREAAYHV